MTKEIVRHAAMIVGFVIFITMTALVFYRTHAVDSVLRTDRDMRVRLLTFTNEAAAKQYIGFQLSFIKYSQRTMYTYDKPTNTCIVVQMKNVGYESSYIPNFDAVDAVVKECFLLQQVEIGNK